VRQSPAKAGAGQGIQTLCHEDHAEQEDTDTANCLGQRLQNSHSKIGYCTKMGVNLFVKLLSGSNDSIVTCYKIPGSHKYYKGIRDRS